ncbi:MAG: glycosyltransferase family 9 protein [Deltaproteobacteria bacterium]|nr:glycosyltransferase family 9 protein [Deltaproteobacteria bacterium]
MRWIGKSIINAFKNPAGTLKAFLNRWRHIIYRVDQLNLSFDADNLELNRRPVCISHHEPFLSREGRLKLRGNGTIDQNAVKRILILKLDHIGDVILSLPAIKMLRHKYSDARITILAGSWAIPILERVSDIDEIVVLNYFHERSEKWKAPLDEGVLKDIKHRLSSSGFDMVIDLRRHSGTGEVFGWTDVRYKVAYFTKENKRWLTHGLHLSDEMKDTPGQYIKPHISAQLCELVLALPGKFTAGINPFEISPEIFSIECGKEIVERFPRLFGADFRIGIHPGTGNKIRQWPLCHYASLADLFVENLGATVAFFGVDNEKDLVEDIISKMRHPEKAISLAGTTSLIDFISIIRDMKIFIGNVSGPCHIAGLTGVPTLNIFAGQVSSYEWHPLGKKTMAVWLDVPCAPCYKALPEQCPYDLKCLKFLWPENVFDAARELLSTTGYGGKEKKNSPPLRI